MILCVMRMPPSLNGHGGSQRAWLLVEALRRLAPVHFMLIGRKLDADVSSVSIEPLRPLVESLTSVDIPDWQPFSRERLPPYLRKVHTGWFDLLGMRCQEAPRLSKTGIAALAQKLPIQNPQLVFAGRIPTAVIVDQLASAGALRARHKVVDFDDVMSRFRRRQIEEESQRPQTRLLARVDAALIESAEDRVARTWDAVGVCTDEDKALLDRRYSPTPVIKIPNVISRPRLAPAQATTGETHVLFVGNLSFAPNVQGLLAFLEEAWPVARRQARLILTVAGLNPSLSVSEACAVAGATLKPNVPNLEPVYQAADLVIAPILFGGGTRIKIIEAMAYGRPIISTSMGAEGLGLVNGTHALLADDMAGFADALVRLAADPALRIHLASNAHTLQQAKFGFGAMAAAVEQMAAPYL